MSEEILVDDKEYRLLTRMAERSHDYKYGLFNPEFAKENGGVEVLKKIWESSIDDLNDYYHECAED